MYRVLFLCTGNSARSQMAEVQLNKAGKDQFMAFSAGSDPKPVVNPMTLKVMQDSGFNVSHLKPKDLTLFEDEPIDLIITLCDRMKENCPVFPGRPIYAHWGMPDPVVFEGTEAEVEAYFKKTFYEIGNRVHLLVNLNVTRLKRHEIETALGEIAQTWKYIR